MAYTDCITIPLIIGKPGILSNESGGTMINTILSSSTQDTSNSIYSSKDNTGTIIQKNIYLRNNFADIILLKELVGKRKYMNLLKKNKNKLSNLFVESLFKNFKYYITDDKKYILTSNSKYWKNICGNLHKISGTDVLKIYGLSVIEECREKVVVKVG